MDNEMNVGLNNEGPNKKVKSEKLEFEDNPLEAVGDNDGSFELPDELEEFGAENVFDDDVTEEVGDEDDSEIIDEDEEE